MADQISKESFNLESGDNQMDEDFTSEDSLQEERVSQGVVMNQRSSDNRNDDLGLLLDINVMLSVEIGTKQLKINELMKLNKGSVLELDKSAGDPLDIKANGSLIARGEVVISNGKYGIRLTEVVSKNDRTKGF